MAIDYCPLVLSTGKGSPPLLVGSMFFLLFDCIPFYYADVALIVRSDFWHHPCKNQDTLMEWSVKYAAKK